MNFIELTGSDKWNNGIKFLYDFDSGWEIFDRGDQPANWCNNREGRNLSAGETYAEIRDRLALTNPMLRSAPETRAHPPGSCLIGGDCEHVQETRTLPCMHRFTVDGLRNPRPDDKCDGCGETWGAVQAALNR